MDRTKFEKWGRPMETKCQICEGGSVFEYYYNGDRFNICKYCGFFKVIKGGTLKEVAKNPKLVDPVRMSTKREIKSYKECELRNRIAGSLDALMYFLGLKDPCSDNLMEDIDKYIIDKIRVKNEKENTK